MLSCLRRSIHNKESNLDALLLAGELECALTDRGHPLAPLSKRLTDAIAAKDRRAAGSCLPDLEAAGLPREIVVNTPEGFAFYALDPFGFANEGLALARTQDVAVVGIRSAGVALSAVCAHKKGTRITVRPHGHPYDREVTLTAMEQQWVRDRRSEGRTFLVVDEGPGLSGSSFLCVAEALEAAGVPRERIHLIGSRAIDPNRLVARDAARRWVRFDFRAVTKSLGPDRAESISSALWRFEGLGTAGELAAARARVLSDAGQMPRWVQRSRGWSRYGSAEGRRARVADLDTRMVQRLAEYCAFRKETFSTEPISLTELNTMVIHNVKQLLGADLSGSDLDITHPVVCDAQMMPHTWLINEAAILKDDAVTFGDNHFFPGPCDIAWDIAGAIIEWRMASDAADAFIAAYEQRTGDRVRSRLLQYRIAYCAFHAAYAQMKGMSAANEEERERSTSAFEQYRSGLERAVAAFSSKMTAAPAA